MTEGTTRRGPAALRRCTKCLLPETHETIVFDEEGVCNVCRNHEMKREVDWAAKRREFEELLDEYRDKYDYDCIVPFSGGKDSTWTLYSLVREFGLKPLVVSFDHGFMRPTLLQNRERTFKILGVDYLNFRPNWKVVQHLLRESLRRKGDFCWHCHAGIFAYPMQIAVKLRVPLIIWGEPSSEYTAYYSYDQPEEVDERRFNRFVNLGINAEDMVGMLKGEVTERDLLPFTYPDVRELRKLRVRSICQGSYFPWDVKGHVEVIKRELGWKEDLAEGVAPGYGYEKIECAMQGVRDYLRFIKRGYGRTAHLGSIDIRNGRLEHEEGLAMAMRYDGKRPASLDVFLEHIGISEEEFNRIAESQAVAPYRHDWSKTERGPEQWDQEHWDRSAPFPKTRLDPPTEDA